MARDVKLKQDDPKEDKKLTFLDRLSKTLVATADPDIDEKELLSLKDSKMQDAINRELNLSRGIAQHKIVDFIAATNSDYLFGPNRNVGNEPSIDPNALFTNDLASIFSYFQSTKRNKYIELNDLKFISKFIPALSEAVNITLDSITNSDDISGSINRNFIISSSISESNKKLIIQEIERIEKQYKLLPRLKNIVYKKALVSGESNVYAISYAELFNQYDAIKRNRDENHLNSLPNMNPVNKQNYNRNTGYNDNPGTKSSRKTLRLAKESFTHASLLDDDTLNRYIAQEASIYIENTVNEMMVNNPHLFGVDNSKGSIDTLLTEVKEHLATFSFDDSQILFEAMNEVEAMEATGNVPGRRFNPILMKSYNDTFMGDVKDFNKKFSISPDATVASNGATARAGNSNLYNVEGTYIKYIDSRQLVPLNIFNTIIGYFHIVSTSTKPTVENNSRMSFGPTFNNMNMNITKKEEVVDNLVNVVTDGILKRFSPQFVQDNIEFKNMISECIVANGIVDNQYKIQFIPAEYIHSFKINENENGDGESIIANALFPAKLLLSILICKLLNYINKSGNKTIVYTHKGPIGSSDTNQINRVIRMLQEGDITFNDLLSSQLVFSKFTRDSYMAIPMSKQDKKLIELETQEGQQVDLNTNIEDWLERQVKLGTPVPASFMDSVSSVDFAKQIVSDNIRFAGRISSLQSDLETTTTELYKELLKNSMLDDDLKDSVINSFMFKLIRPKLLSNVNFSDYINTLINTYQSIGELVYSGGNEDLQKIKNEFVFEMIKKNSEFFDWDALEEVISNLKIKQSKEKLDSESDNESDDESPDSQE